MKGKAGNFQSNVEAPNQGVRADILYGNILDQQRYFFVLPYVREKRILDCACGVGWGAYIMSLAGAEEVTAIDISANAVSAALRYYSRPNIKYICTDLLATVHDFKKVDIITSFETLEHVLNPEEFLAKLKEVSHIETLLFLSTPNAVAFKSSADHPPYNPFHVDEYSKEQLLAMFSKVGWSVVQYLGQHPMPANSVGISNYKKFLKDYWDHFSRTSSGYFWRIYYLMLRKLIKLEFAEPAHQGNCYPVSIDDNVEPAYHYFILKPMLDFK